MVECRYASSCKQQKDMGHRGETIRVQDSGRPNQNPVAETENALSDKKSPPSKNYAFRASRSKKLALSRSQVYATTDPACEPPLESIGRLLDDHQPHDGAHPLRAALRRRRRPLRRRSHACRLLRQGHRRRREYLLQLGPLTNRRHHPAPFKACRGCWFLLSRWLLLGFNHFPMLFPGIS